MAGPIIGIPSFDPIGNVTPFTYSDGDTYLTVLEKIKNNLNLTTDQTNLHTDSINQIGAVANAAVDAVNEARADAAEAAQAARDAANLVGAPAEEILDLIMGGASRDFISTTLTELADRYTKAAVDSAIQVLSDAVSARYTKTESDGRFSRKAYAAFNVKDFGAVGNGIADDTQAIQDAVNATAMGGDLYFPQGTYRVSPRYVDATTGWGHCIVLTNRIRVVGSGSSLITTADFAARNIMMLARAYDITIENLRFGNDHVGSSPWSVGIGMGDTYDSQAGSYRRLRIRNCYFENQWLSVSCQLKDGSINTLGNISVESCYSIASSTAASAGNFNFRTETPSTILNVNISDCQTSNGVSASAYNLYGVYYATLTNNIAHGNKYAGMELENGCSYVTVNNFTAASDCAIGLWIDDSRRIVVNGMTFQGTAGISRRALYITYGSAQPNVPTEHIVINGLVSYLGRIELASFGSVLGGSFGLISMSDIQLFLDGINQNRGILFSSTEKDLIIRNTHIYGAAQDAIAGTMNTPGVLRMSDCTSRKFGNEASNGMTLFGTGNVTLNMCDLHGTITAPTYITEMQGRRTITTGTGTPEGNVVASPGSLYLNRNGGAGTTLYVKQGGSAVATGWAAVTGTGAP